MNFFRIHRNLRKAVLIFGLGLYLTPSGLCASLPLLQQLDTANEQEVRQIREQEITQLKIVLGRREAQNRRPDLLLRLAELYTEEYRHYFLKENELHQARLKSGRRESMADHEVSRRFLEASNNSCFAILQSKQEFSGTDKVYFILGYNFGELGRREDSKKYYGKLVSGYPHSPVAAEAHRALGEAAFERGSYSVAIENLERAVGVAQKGNESILPRTLYKLAWSYYRSRRISDALSTMKRAIRLAGDDEKFISLREEALNDIVVFYADIGRYQEAHSYFTDISGGEKFLAEALSRLAKTYERSGKTKQALNILEELIASSTKPAPDKMVAALAQVIELYRKAGDAAGEERSLKRLVKFFEVQGEELRNENEDTKQIWLRTKNYLRARATEQHKAAQKSGQVSSFARAAELYSLYRTAFLREPQGGAGSPEWNEYGEILTYQADCLLHGSDETKGMLVLRELFESKATAAKKREAGLTLANIYLKRIDSALARKKSEELKGLEKELTKLSEKLQDDLGDSAASDAGVVELELKRLRLSYMIAKDFPDEASKNAGGALKELLKAVEAHPTHIESGKGALEALRRERTQELAERLAQNRPLLAAEKSGELAKAVQAVLARESFAASQNLESEGKFTEAARHYVEVAEEAARRREFDLRDKSWNNAAVSYERAGQVPEALQLYEKLTTSPDRTRIAQAKSSAFRALLTLSIRSQYETLSTLSHSASFWPVWSIAEKADLLNLSLAASFGIKAGSPSAPWLQMAKVLNSAKNSLCVNRETGGGKSRKVDKNSLDSCFDFLSAWYQSLDSLDVRHLHITDDGITKLMDVLNSYLSGASGSNPALRGLITFSLHRLALKAGLESQAKRFLENSSAVPLAALKSLASEDQSFHELKIEGDDATVRVRTESKIKKLQSLVTRYEGVLKLAQDAAGSHLSSTAPFSANVAIQALSRLGLAYLDLAQALQSAPSPRSLTAEAQAQYSAQISKVSQDFLGKSKEFISRARAKCQQLKLVSASCGEAAAASYRAGTLNRLVPLAFERVSASCEGKRGFCIKLGFVPPSHDATAAELLEKLYATNSANLRGLWIDHAAQELFEGRPELSLAVLGLGAGVRADSMPSGISAVEKANAGLVMAAGFSSIDLVDKAAAIVFDLSRQQAINTTVRYNGLLLAILGQQGALIRENASVLRARWSSGGDVPDFAGKYWPLLDKAAQYADGSLSKELWLDAADDFPAPTDWFTKLILKDDFARNAEDAQSRRGELDSYPELQGILGALVQGRL